MNKQDGGKSAHIIMRKSVALAATRMFPAIILIYFIVVYLICFSNSSIPKKL